MDRKKSIEELEGVSWSAPAFNSHLVTECHRLRTVPIESLSVENLRMLIGQNIALELLVPIALDHLESAPLASGAMYKGDLLFSLASVQNEFWVSNSQLNNRLVEIKIEVEEIGKTINEQLLPKLQRFTFL